MRPPILAVGRPGALLASSRRGARSLFRQFGSTIVAAVLLAIVLDLVASPSAKAVTDAWYAYATATTSGLTACPQSSVASEQCTLAEALSDVTPGGTVYLATAGDYTGNWAIATAGTSASSPVTVQPGPGISNPFLNGDFGGGVSVCQTPSCVSSVLTVGTGVYAQVDGITIYNADNTTSGDGGAISNSGTLTATATTFADVAANDFGGAIYNDGGSVTVSGSTFIGDGATYDGGAIYNLGGSVVVSGSVFEADSANQDGGAIYNTDGGSVTVSGSTLDSNSATDAGGAMYTSGGNLTVSGSTFTANVARLGLGGAIYNTGTLTAWASTFSVYANPDTGNLIYGGGLGAWLGADIFDGSCSLGSTGYDVGYNVASDATCLGGGPSDVDYAKSLIDVLGTPSNNGGPNRSIFFETMLPLPGNPALGLIPGTPPVAVELHGSDITLCPTTDQRGDQSTTGQACDAGAVQVPSTTTPSTTTTAPTTPPPAVGGGVPVAAPPTTMAAAPATPTAPTMTATTTATTAAPTTRVTTSKDRPARPVVGELTKRAALSRGRVGLALRCSRAPCRGTIKLWYRHVLVGKDEYSIRAGLESVLTVALKPSVAKRLAAMHGHKLLLTQTVTVTGGSTARRSLRLSS